MIIHKWKCHNLLIIMSLFSRYSLKTILARTCSLWIKSLSLYKNLYSVFTNDRKRCIGQNVEIDFGAAVAQNHPFRGGNMQNNLRFFKQHRHLVCENGTYVTTNKRQLRQKLSIQTPNKHYLTFPTNPQKCIQVSDKIKSHEISEAQHLPKADLKAI